MTPNSRPATIAERRGAGEHRSVERHLADPRQRPRREADDDRAGTSSATTRPAAAPAAESTALSVSICRSNRIR